MLGPVGHTSKTCGESGGIGGTTIGGDIDREVAASRILIPEFQLHRLIGRQAQRFGL